MVSGRSFNLPAFKCLYRSVVDPGKGPGGPTPLTFGPICGPKGREKNFFRPPHPPYLRVWMTSPPPLSEDLDPPMQVHYNDQVTFLVVSRQSWHYTLVINSQSIIPSTDVIQLTLILKMTTAQVVETSVTVNNNSPIQDYVHPDDQTQPTFEMTLGFKPFNVKHFIIRAFLFISPSRIEERIYIGQCSTVTKSKLFRENI